MQSPTFFVTETDPRFSQQKQLTVTEAGRAVKVETDLPHLVSLGSGRFSTAVTLHPLPEGKTTVGCMNADITVRGRGIQPEHCYFLHERDVVILFPVSNMITVDGAKVTRPTILSQGSMICFGRSSYFRFNHPAEAQHLKEEYFDIYSDTYSTADVFSKKEPLYANEDMSTSSTTSTTEDSISIPLYDNVTDAKASREKSLPNGNVSHGSGQDFNQSFSRRLDDFRTCSSIGSFHSDGLLHQLKPDDPSQHQRSVENRYVTVESRRTPEIFDEKASHIPRPISPLMEGLTADNWSGYDNVLELKEAIKNLKFKQELHITCEYPAKTGNEISPTGNSNFSCQHSSNSVQTLIKSDVDDDDDDDDAFLNRTIPPPSESSTMSKTDDRDTDSVKVVCDDSTLKRQTSSEPQPDKRRVTFNIKDEKKNSEETKGGVESHDASSKPPSGKQNFEHLKKHDNKREKKFLWSKKTLTGSLDNETGKTSFFKSLMRSRSPSPTGKRSPSPVSLKCPDVARRLSEPLKVSFKNPDSSVREKYSGKQLKNEKQEETSSSDEEIPLNSKVIVPKNEQSSPTASSAGAENLGDLKVPTTQSSVSSDSSTTVPPSLNADLSRKVNSLNTTDDEKCRSSLLVEQKPVGCNPWKASVKSRKIDIGFDNYKGEKLFSRDVATTSVSIPVVSTPSKGEVDETIHLSESTSKPVPHLQTDDKPASTDNPIYDSVYEGHKLIFNDVVDGDVESSARSYEDTFDHGGEEKHFSDDVFESLNKISSSDKQSYQFVPDSSKPGSSGSKDDRKNVDEQVVKMTSSSGIVRDRSSSGSGVICTSNYRVNIPEPPRHRNEDHSSERKISKTSIQLKSSPVSDTLYSEIKKPAHSAPASRTSALSNPPVKSIPLEKNREQLFTVRSGVPRGGSVERGKQELKDDSTLKPLSHTSHKNSTTSLTMERSTSKDSQFISPLPLTGSSSKLVSINSNKTVSGKPPICELNKPADDEMTALVGARRGVLMRMKQLKQRIEEIEEKEKNIEGLISRNSLSIDTLEKKQISEKDIREFFSNATNALNSLDEEGKKVESQFMEANEYLNQINKSIGEAERKKKQLQALPKVPDHKTTSHPNSYSTSRNHNQDLLLPRSSASRTSIRDKTSNLNDILKISSESSDNSSIFGSATLVEKSLNGKGGKDSSVGSLALSEKNTPTSITRNSTCRPLTRYFPVTDSSFDLRCYIESSGHNLDMCKTVTVESFKCCGYLSKMGRKWKKWHKRWFVFDRTKRHLACYLEEPHGSTKHPRSACYFQSIRDVFADHLHMVKSPNPDFTFCVKLVDKNLYLMAASADAMRIWIDVLFTGAEAYEDTS